MDMKAINSGRLRAIGYDPATRLMQVQLDNGDTLQYRNIGHETWRRLNSASSPWSYYRDHIEEEYEVQRISGKPGTGGRNPLDELFG